VPHAIRPGDVLADRYHLVDLLDESAGGLFWRAYDSMLDRSVALHLIRADDPRAELLRDAARTSAQVVDRRVLRVLDVDETTEQTAGDGGALCYVVNEWASGVSLDILLADEGPLAPRRAAWLVSEVASTLDIAHTAGVAHGRLVPENVLIDRTGSVRVIGFAVDAALHGLPSGRLSTDVADLAALLYAALTGTWPGVAPSAVRTAPHTHGRVLRPRQVRAGVPRVLDALCDAVLNPYAAAPGSHARGNVDVTTAGGIADALREFVGDPAGLAEAEVAAVRRRESGSTTMTMPMALPGTSGALPFPDDPLPHHIEPEPEPPAMPPAIPVAIPVAVPVAGQVAALEPDPDADDADDAEPDSPSPPVDQPTQAGIPIFDESGDVSWIAKRTEKPPPPPPFERAPERPLFAPDPVDGTPVRRPRVPAAPGSPEYWPWDTSTGTGIGSRITTGSGVIEPVDDEEPIDRPGTSWLRLAAVVAACLVLLLGIVFAFNLGRGLPPLGGDPSPSPSSSPTASGSAGGAEAGPYTGLTATDFDPQGDPPEENSEDAPLVLDGDPDTAWRTMTYSQNLGPAGLKTGVGLTIDLGESLPVSEVQLTLRGQPTALSVYVTDEPPTGIRGLTAAGTVTADGTTAEVVLDDPPTGRYVTVWLTSLPPIEGGYRGEVAEVTVLG
jgi:serine/threonine protein kinase